jgi:hypothetical protein
MASLQVSGIRDLRMPFTDLSKGTTGRKCDLDVHVSINCTTDSARAIAESSIEGNKSSASMLS